MTMIIKQATSIDVGIGPFLDDTDGKTAETALTLTQPDIRLKKNGGAWAQKAAAQTLSHEENGWYECTLDATDTDTVGQLIVAVHESGALPVWREFQVVEEAIYDALFAASAAGALTVAAVTGAVGSVTGAVGSVTGNVGGNVTGSVGSVATGGIAAVSFAAGAINAAAIATDAIDADAIKADAVTELQAGLATAASIAALNNLSAAQVNAEVDTALADINLDHLVKVAVDTDFPTTVHLNSVIGHLADNGTTATFDRTTDSQEAIRDKEADIETDTQDIQARLPAALVSGRIDASVGAMAANTLTAAATAADYLAEINTEVDTALADYDGPTHAELTAELATADDATLAAIAALNNLSAAGVRTAVGLASANLDTQLDALPTAAENADAVWEETLTDHSGTVGSTAEALGAAGSAGDPWSTALPGAYGAGSAGKIIGDTLDAAVSSRLADADYTAPDNATISAIAAKTTNLPSDPADESLLEAAITAATSPLATAAALSTVAGYVDTEVAAILAAVDTEVAAIKAKTDNLPADPADQSAVEAAITAAVSGLAVPGSAMTLTSGERTAVADALLDRDMSTGTDSGSATVRTVRQALRFLRNKWSVSGGTLSVTKEDDTTESWAAAVTQTAGDPVSAVDPASS